MTRFVVMLSALAIGACSLNALDGFSSGGVPADLTDGSVPTTEALDAGDVDAAVAFANGGDGCESLPNLVPNPGFEATDGLGCGAPYARSSYNAELSPVMTARSGARACRVCNTSGPMGENFTLDPLEEGYVDVTPGRYEIEGWVRMDDKVGVDVTVGLRVYRGGMERAFLTTPSATTGPSWTRLHAVVDVELEGRGEVLLASPIKDQRSCFLVDDLALRRVD